MAVFADNIQRDVEIELDAALEELDFQNDGGIDMTAALRQMRELDEAAGDWKDHLPYEAAISYLVDDAVRGQFEEHVSGCQFCRDMIDALNPGSKVLGELHQTAYDVYTDAPESDSYDLPKEDDSSRGRWPLIPIAASILLGVAIGGFVLPIGKDDNGPPSDGIASRSEELPSEGITTMSEQTKSQVEPSDPFSSVIEIPPRIETLTAGPFDRLVALEESTEPEDQFLAARLYFDQNLDAVAFRRIGQGLSLGGAAPELVRTVTTLPPIDLLDAKTLQLAQTTLWSLKEMNIYSPDDYLRKFEVSAALGERDEALNAIDGFLRLDSETEDLAFLFDEVVLTGTDK